VRLFLPLAGACGWVGFWAWACACDSRDARVRASAQGGRSASQAKALRRRQGRAFFPPLSLAIQRKGARGQRGRAAPEEWRWASLCFVLRPQQEPLARDCIARLRHSINNRDAARRVATNAEDPVPGHSPVGGHSLRSAPPLPRTR